MDILLDILLTVVGLILVAFAVVDVFYTALSYDNIGWLSTRIYRVTWRILRRLGDLVSAERRLKVLALGVPLMIAASLAVWIMLMVIGFGLVYYVGLQNGAFALQEGLKPTLVTAMYLSGVSGSTLGFGDVTAITNTYKMATALQALTGFTLLTLGISYVINVNQIVRQMAALSGELVHQAMSGSGAVRTLGPHFPQGQARGLGERLLHLHQRLIEFYEGIRHYPLVYYFFSRRAFASTPYVVRATGEMAAALRWGLPSDHRAAQDPWLPTLTEDLNSIIGHVRANLLRVAESAPPEAIGYDRFTEAMRGDFETGDPWADRFLALDKEMARMARLPTSSDPRDAYPRYKKWLPFAHRIESFVGATGADLGYLESDAPERALNR